MKNFLRWNDKRVVMPDKEDQIIEELKRRSRECVKFGTLLVEFKIQDGKILAGEIIEQKIKLG